MDFLQTFGRSFPLINNKVELASQRKIGRLWALFISKYLLFTVKVATQSGPVQGSPLFFAGFVLSCECFGTQGIDVYQALEDICSNYHLQSVHGLIWNLVIGRQMLPVECHSFSVSWPLKADCCCPYISSAPPGGTETLLYLLRPRKSLRTWLRPYMTRYLHNLTYSPFLFGVLPLLPECNACIPFILKSQGFLLKSYLSFLDAMGDTNPYL